MVRKDVPCWRLNMTDIMPPYSSSCIRASSTSVPRRSAIHVWRTKKRKLLTRRKLSKISSYGSAG